MIRSPLLGHAQRFQSQQCTFLQHLGLPQAEVGNSQVFGSGSSVPLRFACPVDTGFKTQFGFGD
jgi:hypothetical protein